MDIGTKSKLKGQLTAMNAMNQSFKTAMQIPPIVIVTGNPPMPVILQPVLQPYLQALKDHGEEFDKLLRLMGEVIDKA